MTTPPRMTVQGVVLSSDDPKALADFYQRLLDWEIGSDEEGWVTLKSPNGGAGLSFQSEEWYPPPSWPARPGDQHMMAHLDIRVDDLAAGEAHAREVGATLADYQPQDDVRVYLDPAGHPFCLFE